MSDEAPELDLQYPCAWTYKVVGRDEAALRSAVAAVIGEREHDLTWSRASSGGRYVSLRLVLQVTDDSERRGLGAALDGHADVKFVL